MDSSPSFLRHGGQREMEGGSSPRSPSGVRVDPELPAPSAEFFAPLSRSRVLEGPCNKGELPLASRRTSIIIRLLGGQRAVVAWVRMLFLPLAGLGPQPSHFFPLSLWFLICNMETTSTFSRRYYEHQILISLPLSYAILIPFPSFLRWMLFLETLRDN